MSIPCCPECRSPVQEDVDGNWNCTVCDWVGDDPDHKDDDDDE